MSRANTEGTIWSQDIHTRAAHLQSSELPPRITRFIRGYRGRSSCFVPESCRLKINVDKDTGVSDKIMVSEEEEEAEEILRGKKKNKQKSSPRKLLSTKLEEGRLMINRHSTGMGKQYQKHERLCRYEFKWTVSRPQSPL